MKPAKNDMLHKLVREVWQHRTDFELCDRILERIRIVAPQHPLADAVRYSYGIYRSDILNWGDDRRAYGFARGYGELYLEFCVRRKFYGNGRKGGVCLDRDAGQSLGQGVGRKEVGEWEMRVQVEQVGEGRRKERYNNRCRQGWN